MIIKKPTKVFLKKNWNIFDDHLLQMNNELKPLKRSFSNSEDVWIILDYELLSEENNFFDSVKIKCNVVNNDSPCYLVVGIYENVHFHDNFSDFDIVKFIKNMIKTELNSEINEYFFDFDNKIFFDKNLTKKMLFLKLEDKCNKLNGFYNFYGIDIILN